MTTSEKSNEKAGKELNDDSSENILEVPPIGEGRPVLNTSAPDKTAVIAKEIAAVEREEPAGSSTSPVRNKDFAEREAAISLSAENVPVDDQAILAAMSPVDRLLALPELPRLERENRARLLMQTPSRLYFYWTLREDPWSMLRKAFGDDTGSYTLVLKLIELRFGTEQIYNADAEGNWWFDVMPDGEYQAEIGFYAPNRPYFRIIHSNIIETPRRKPSTRRASESHWSVTADKYAKVLDVTGFARDAVNVAIAGDDRDLSAGATRLALSDLTGDPDVPTGFSDDDIRHAILEMAGGQKLDDLRWTIGPDLFEYLQSKGPSLDAVRAQSVLAEHFEMDEQAYITDEFGPAVYGLSLVNFPRSRRSLLRSRVPGQVFESVGSHSYRRPSGRS